MTLYHPGRPEAEVEENFAVGLDPALFNSRWPLVCRWPKGRRPQGVAIFCHGLGSSGMEYAELSRTWARNGYLVIHPTFSDWVNAVAAEMPELGLDPRADNRGWAADPVLMKAMHGVLHDSARWLERLKVVRAVIDLREAIAAATCGPLEPTVRWAIAGHSFGAYVAQLLAGAVIDLPGQSSVSFRDDRFSAAILLSAQGRNQQGLREGSWDSLEMPMLNVTGTRDRGAKGGDWHWKCEPYEFSPGGDKYLAVLDDADHYLGGFRGNDGSDAMVAQVEAVKALTLAFLDAQLRRSPAAAAWLDAVSGNVGACPLLFKRK